MSVVNISKANLKYFKPNLTTRHNPVYKWLIESGYTVSYLCLSLGIRVEELSGYFREPHKLTLRQTNTVIVLLRGIKEPNLIVKTLLLPFDETNNKTNEELKTLYNEIVLPPASRSVPVHRLDYVPKDKKE